MPYFDKLDLDPTLFTAAAKPKANEPGDMRRGLTAAFQQIPQLGYGLMAGAGAALETAAGEGGIGTGIKQAGIRGFAEWGDKIAADSKETDSFSTAYNRAKEGDIGALADWLQYGLGYAGGQAVQLLAGAGAGTLAGKALLGTAAEKAAKGMVQKEAARLAAANAAQGGARVGVEDLLKQATKNVAGKIGQTTAVAAQSFGMTGGEIFGGLTADNADRALTGDELAKAFGATLAAGGLEFAADKLGLDLILGKSKLLKPAESIPGMKGRAARAGVGAMAQMPIEGGTEYLQTGIENYGRGSEASPFTFNQSEESRREAFDAAALGAVGGGAIGAVGGGFSRATAKRQADADRALDDFKAATDPDAMVDAALRATDVPLDVPPAGGTTDADGVITPRRRSFYDEFSALEPAQQQEARALLNVSSDRTKPPQQRAAAKMRLDAMLLEAGIIPVGEVTEADPLLPVGEAQELTATEATSQIVQPPDFEQRRAMGKRVPTGEATELTPEEIELETIPQPDVIEAGGDLPLPEGMAPRTPKQPEPAPAKPMTDADIVAAVVDGFRKTNTPQARAFVQDFDAGRIKPADVLQLVGRPPQSPDERLAAAAAQAPKKTDIQPGDILTVDGQPFGTRSGAYVRAKKEGGDVIEVPGGWAVRPKESAREQPDVAGAARRPQSGQTVVGQLADEENTRVQRDSGIPSMVRDEAAMPQSGDRQLRPLRGAGDRNLSRVDERLSSLPQERGAAPDASAFPGQVAEQRRQLRAGELPMGDTAAAGGQQEYQRQSDASRRDEEPNRVGRGKGNRAEFGATQDEPRDGLGRRADAATGENRTESGKALPGERQDAVDRRDRGNVGSKAEYDQEADRERGSRGGAGSTVSDDGERARREVDRVPGQRNDDLPVGGRSRGAEKPAQEQARRRVDDGARSNDAKAQIATPLKDRAKAMKERSNPAAPASEGVVAQQAAPDDAIDPFTLDKATLNRRLDQIVAADEAPDLMRAFVVLRKRYMAATGRPSIPPAGSRAVPMYPEGAAPATAQQVPPAEATPKRTEARRTAKHPQTVMGSRLLAQVSISLDGLHPSLLSEFSERFETARKDRYGRPMMQWRNPMIPGVGLLFRRSGTSDRSQIAQTLEDYGYLPPGTFERDYKEAGEQAKDLIRAALNREEVKTQDEIEADAIADQEAERQAYYAEVDAESAAELEAERAAIMAGDNLTTQELDALTDEDLFDGQGTTDTEASMRAMGFTEQEIADELAKEAAARAAKAGAQEDRQDEARGARPAAEDRGAAARPAGQEGLTLKAQTPEDLKAKADREEAATKAAASKKAAEQERLRREAEARDLKARADATVDDFQLGQDANRQMSGMGDMFADPPVAAPAPAEPTGPTPNYAAGDRITPDKDVIEGDVVRYDGATWMAKVKRGVTVPLHPIVNGKPEVNADSLVRVDLNDNEVTHTGMNVYGYGGQPKPSEKTAASDLFGAKVEDVAIAKRDLEAQRRTLIDLENRMVGMAGLRPDMLDDALRSRKVPKALKDQRDAIREDMTRLREQIASLEVPVRDMEQYIKVAADSIEQLRKTDVYRVLVESNRAEFRQDIATYIKANRPDLAREVDDVMAEQEPATSAPQAAEPEAAPTADPFAADYAALVGKTIEQTVTTDDGKTAKLRMDAARALRDFDQRQKTLQDLKACLGRNG